MQITGLGLIGSGAYLRVEKDDYLDLCDKYSFVTGANILIAVGVIVVIVAFFGCFGAFKENSCMLGIVSLSFLLVVMVLKVAILDRLLIISLLNIRRTHPSQREH